MNKSTLGPILLINVAMLCVSTSGPLGRYIALSPPVAISYRALFALLFLGIFCVWNRYSFQFSIKKDGWTLFLTGILMTIHWVTYFYALKWANVAIGMLSLFTYPIITSFLEPILLKTPFQRSHLGLGGLILLGIYFIAPSFDLKDTMLQGLLIGLVSAFSYALRNVILKRKINSFNGSILMFYQMVIATVLMSPFLLQINMISFGESVPYLIFLGLVTTAIGHTLFLNSFQYFSVSTASIMSSVQPIYGIILAMLFIKEFPTWQSVIGGVLILTSVIIASKKRQVSE